MRYDKWGKGGGGGGWLMKQKSQREVLFIHCVSLVRIRFPL